MDGEGERTRTWSQRVPGGASTPRAHSETSVHSSPTSQQEIFPQIAIITPETTKTAPVPGQISMAGNSFGELFRITSFGESHGPALGAIVDGCPPGLALSEEDLQGALDRR